MCPCRIYLATSGKGLKCRADAIKHLMIKEVWEAGLAPPPPRFTTNASESFKFNAESRCLVQEELTFCFHSEATEVGGERAGVRVWVWNYRLRKILTIQAQLSHLQIPGLKWFSQMSEQRSLPHLTKKWRKRTSPPPECHMWDRAVNQPLSIDVHDTGLSVPQGIIDRILKASELLST